MSMSVLPFPAGEPGGDLLEQPAVAVRVVERGEHEVRAPFHVQARWPLLEHLADIDAAADEIFPGGVDVLDREDYPLEGSRLTGGDALAEVDRAPGVRRRHLHGPDLAGVQVDV